MKRCTKLGLWSSLRRSCAEVEEEPPLLPVYDENRAPPRQSTGVADAFKENRRIARRRRLDFRAQVGRVSRAGIPGRGGNPDSKPRRKTVEPVFPRAARAAKRAIARALRS